MATMIPEEVDHFKTEGEKRFPQFLRTVAKPDKHYTAWYLPQIEGREPDFILYCAEVGLIIFEVKDWALSQIRNADSFDFVIKAGSEEQRHRNPLRQASEYLYLVMERIRKGGRLISKDPAHYGKAKLPIECGVVFPNINKYEYCQYGLHVVIPADKAFFWDDLHSASEISCDTTGKCFRKAIQERFPPKFSFHLAAGEYGYLKQLLFPSAQIAYPGRDSCAYMDLSQRTEALDDRQEAIARNCSSGYNVVTGPSGSGKTLILIHKAAFLKQYNPQIRDVLFVCFNITLVNFIKRLLARKGIQLGPGGVEVYHFFELCAKIIGEKVAYEKEDRTYYDLVVEEALSAVRAEGRKYDAVLVDEGQDLSEEMLKVVVEVMNPEVPNFTVALDETQNIYARNLAWRNHLGGRNREMSVPSMYRNSWEIRSLAQAFLKSPKDSRRAKDAHASCILHGPKPELKQFLIFHEMLAYAADTIRLLVQNGEYPLSEIAVLYTTRTATPEEARSLPEMVTQMLESRSIMSQWVSEDYRAKRAYDITTEGVAVSTIHSAKGLDYACIFLLGIDRLKPDYLSAEQIDALVYVGMTRARHRLFIPYIQESEIISRLVASLRSVA